jgi:outer membrane lipoprotein-sorting protein
VNILRRLPLSRLLLLCALVLAIGVSATALAFAIGAGPTPPPKPLAQAIHDALEPAGHEQVQGLSASITLTDHLLEGASLAGGGHDGASSPEGELTSNPLVTGASGRLWIAKDGDARLELQSQRGDTQILYDGHTLSLYDAATNTLYRYTVPPPQSTPSARHAGVFLYKGNNPAALKRAIALMHRRVDELGVAEPEIVNDGSRGFVAVPSLHQHEVPTVAKIEEAIARLGKHADVSGATPTDVAGQPAYTVRVSPNESGSLFGGVELSFDADNGTPLRAAICSSTSTAPVIELAATEVSYGPVSGSVFEINPPADAKVVEVKPPSSSEASATNKPTNGAGKPKITTYGHGPATIGVLEDNSDGSAAKSAGEEPLEGLPKVTINGVSASELRTELGTLLTFERSGVRYLLAGSVAPAAIEAIARGQ